MPASPSNITNSLELQGLHKAYGQTVAVRRVDLEIDTPIAACLARRVAARLPCFG